MNDILNEPIQIHDPSKQQVNPDVVRIAALIDESGSMFGAAADTIKNLNSYIDEQATSEKETLMSVYTFNSDHGVRDRFVSIDAKKAPRLVLKGVPINSSLVCVPKGLATDNSLVYAPSGGTPLYDAIATVITKETSAFPTLVVILTDGEENASREYRTRKSIQDLIKQQEESGWCFVFLMAGLDREEAEQYTSGLMGRNYGGATMNYSKGTEDIAFQNLYTASAVWESNAREVYTSGGIVDSMAVTQGFFDSSIREIKKENLGVDIQQKTTKNK